MVLVIEIPGHEAEDDALPGSLQDMGLEVVARGAVRNGAPYVVKANHEVVALAMVERRRRAALREANERAES